MEDYGVSGFIMFKDIKYVMGFCCEASWVEPLFGFGALLHFLVGWSQWKR